MPLTQAQLERYGEDRRPELYVCMAIFLVVNNVAVVARLIAHWRAHYKTRRSMFIEDIFIVLSGVCCQDSIVTES